MTLTEDNYREIINSYTKKNWQPLLDLITEIEKTFSFGELKGGEKNEREVIQIPFWDASQIVHRFNHIVYEIPIVISFNWGAWEEGKRIINDNNFDYNSIDIPTKCKMITEIVRSDRLCDGELVYAFESGIILKILKSIDIEINKNCKTIH